MAKLNDQQIAAIRGDSVYLQGELNSLDRVGWDSKTPAELTELTKQLSELEAARGAMRDVNPTGKQGQERLQMLVEQENYSSQAVSRLKETATKAVRAEQKRFLENVQPDIYDPLEADVKQADETIQAALSQLATGLKDRWNAMQKIGAASGLVEGLAWQIEMKRVERRDPQLPSPFERTHLRDFSELVRHYMNRISSTFRNGSEQGSDNMAAAVYDRKF